MAEDVNRGRLEGQELTAVELAALPKGCLVGQHHWPPVLGSQPWPASAWDGTRCYCGARELKRRTCELGFAHVVDVATAGPPTG